MVLGALTSQLKLESSEDFSPTCLAPCWVGWLASLFHATSPNKYPELPHGMAVSEYSDFLDGPSVPVHRKWRLHSLEAFAQKTDTESLLPYFTWQSSHQTHPNSKGRRYRPYFSTGELKPALTHYTQSCMVSITNKGLMAEWAPVDQISAHVNTHTPRLSQSCCWEIKRGIGELCKLAIYSVFISLPISKAGQVIRKKEK